MINEVIIKLILAMSIALLFVDVILIFTKMFIFYCDNYRKERRQNKSYAKFVGRWHSVISHSNIFYFPITR